MFDESDVMVSYDVTSRFTKVPVSKALDAVAEMLRKDKTVDERTTMSTSEVYRLMSLCLRSSYFRFKDMFFEQRDGAAMESPLSPIVTNFYMEAFEKQALSSSILSPIL